MNARRLALVLTLMCLSSGCYRTTIVHGRRESRTARPPLNDTSRAAYMNGMFEDGPLYLESICKEEGGDWATIHIETGLLNTLANLSYGVIAHTQNVTVKCAESPAGY